MTDADKWVLKGLSIFFGLVIGPYVFLAIFLIFCFSDSAIFVSEIQTC